MCAATTRPLTELVGLKAGRPHSQCSWHWPLLDSPVPAYPLNRCSQSSVQGFSKTPFNYHEGRPRREGQYFNDFTLFVLKFTQIRLSSKSGIKTDFTVNSDRTTHRLYSGNGIQWVICSNSSSCSLFVNTVTSYTNSYFGKMASKSFLLLSTLKKTQKWVMVI